MINYFYQLKPFRSDRTIENSLWKNIPIEELENVQRVLRETFPVVGRSGQRFLYRFRGSRTQPGRISRQQTCLKRDANRFSVYVVNRQDKLI